MAQQKRSGNAFEVSALLVVILIPIGFALYAYWNSIQPATPIATQATTQTATPSIPSASISLNNAVSLPATTTAAQLVPFSFTIQNTGSGGGNIPFKVYVKWSTGEEDVIDENIVSLEAGQSTTINEQLKFEVANETAEVYLELTQTGQTVQFALPKTK